MSTTTDDPEVTDAEVIEGGEALPPVGTELVAHQGYAPQAHIIEGNDPDEIIANASKIADSMKKLVEAQEFAVNMGGRKKHLEIGAWQALAALTGALGGEPLHPEVVYSRKVEGSEQTYHVHEKIYSYPDGKRTHTGDRDYDATGYDFESKVEIKTAAGVVVGSAEGMCSRSESQWMQKPDPAVKSMAETRAQSRAYRGALGWVVAIAGYNPTPAEELTEVQAQQQAAPAAPYGTKVSVEQLATCREALAYLLNVDPDHNSVGGVLNEIEEQVGRRWEGQAYLPSIAAAAIVYVGRAAKAKREALQQAAAVPGGDDPAQETAEEKVERERAERLAEEHGS